MTIRRDEMYCCVCAAGLSIPNQARFSFRASIMRPTHTPVCPANTSTCLIAHRSARGIRTLSATTNPVHKVSTMHTVEHGAEKRLERRALADGKPKPYAQCYAHHRTQHPRGSPCRPRRTAARAPRAGGWLRSGHCQCWPRRSCLTGTSLSLKPPNRCMFVPPSIRVHQQVCKCPQ